MTFYLLAVGRVRDAALRAACEQFTARIRRYFKFEVLEVREGGRPESDAKRARRLEASAVLRAIPSHARVVVFSRTGESLDSEGFARRVDTWRREAIDVALVIGGAFGVDEEIRRQATACISLSPLTMPHELTRVVVLEQLYRAGTILRGQPYHKGHQA